MTLLEQAITRKKQLGKNIMRLEFEANNNKKYVVKGICGNVIYARELKGHDLLGLYYLVT